MSQRNALNGAQVIVDYLIQEKVPQVFGLCGHGNIQFIDALYERSADIKTISVHHESVAGFMADVYYRVSGKPTATFTSCGPGSANLPISLANAYLDLVPFMAVTGNVPTSQFNRGAFQEMYRHYQADFPSTVRSICKKVFQPTRGEMVPLAVRQAWKTMVTGRPGPVVLDVPFDVFMESAAEEAPNAQDWNGNISSRCGADPEGVIKAVDMLLGAERPVMLVGQGVRYGGASEELRRLAERLQIPWRLQRVVSARSMSIIRWRSAWYLAPDTTRPTMPRDKPTYCLLSAFVSTIGRRAPGSPAIPLRFRRPSLSMSISTRRKSDATIRSRSA